MHVPLVEQGPDVVVFSLGERKIVRDEMTLVPSADGVALSQEVFFLGYPLTGTLPLMGRLPAVRRGIVSQRANLNGVTAWIIDGHNLPGFSGGPLVFADAGGLGSKWHVLGVVSAYWQHRIDVEVAGAVVQNNLGLTVPTNAGLVIVYDIKHAIDAASASAVHRAPAQPLLVGLDSSSVAEATPVVPVLTPRNRSGGWGGPHCQQGWRSDEQSQFNIGSLGSARRGCRRDRRAVRSRQSCPGR